MISAKSSDCPGIAPLDEGPVGVLVSGGVDSCVLIARLLDQGHSVQPFHVTSDLCWHREELRAVQQFLAAIPSDRLAHLVKLAMPMADLYRDHWSVTRRDTPPAGTADDAVYLPGRNALLSIKVALWCQLNGIRVLALAALASNPFADATDSFFGILERVISLPGTPPVKVVTPFSGMTKAEVMRWGSKYPLHLTFSCIGPVDGMHCGACNKCDERQLAFRAAGIDDRSVYARTAGTSRSLEL